ncbi:MAG: MogA/MoaB family molybdenum cofactor biosynthesis protein [Candidatus Binatia bacterium]
MAVHEHHEKGTRRVACAVVTVSDTRTERDDESGRRIRTLLEESGHEVVSHRIVRDEPTLIRDQILLLLTDPNVEAVLMTGGTGISPRDTTFEAIRTLLEKEIEGFGELFRMLSYQEIGSAAMLSRAVAGISSGKVLISMPGSTAAVALAMEKLVIPELGHMLHLLKG